MPTCKDLFQTSNTCIFVKKKNADYGGTPPFYRKSFGEKEITERGLPPIMNQIRIVVFDGLPMWVRSVPPQETEITPVSIPIISADNDVS